MSEFIELLRVNKDELERQYGAQVSNDIRTAISAMLRCKTEQQGRSHLPTGLQRVRDYGFLRGQAKALRVRIQLLLLNVFYQTPQQPCCHNVFG